MGFFGYVIDQDGMEVPIPDGNRLQLLTAIFDPSKSKPKKDGVLVLYAKTDTEDSDDEGIIIGVVNPGDRHFQCSLGQKFGEEDGSLKLWVVGGELHVSGEWTLDDCGHDHGDDDDDECDDEECDMDEDEDEAPELVPVDEEEEEKVSVVPVKSSKKVKRDRVEEVKEVAATEVKPAKKAKVAEGLKKWKVGPDHGEGVIVPEPKIVNKDKGLTITDHVIGTGPEPKPGAAVKMLYEGYLVDGTLFDSKLKKKNPFVFRKGTGQVIKGMDKGLEGMRVGGAREIFVPSALGYGPKGIGSIPGNADLVFRIRLI